MFDSQKTYIVYDGQCPFCSRYVKLLRLRDAAGSVVLVDARQAHPAVRYAEQQGIVLDNEMALIIGGRLYSGPECINRLALMSTPSGIFNRINALSFSSPRTSTLLYPAMRLVRNITLRLLGRPPIRSGYPAPRGNNS
jgi:predicted DCC family thiol-disulfide oxidoreductase YuxK